MQEYSDCYFDWFQIPSRTWQGYFEYSGTRLTNPPGVSALPPCKWYLASLKPISEFITLDIATILTVECESRKLTLSVRPYLLGARSETSPISLVLDQDGL